MKLNIFLMAQVVLQLFLVECQWINTNALIYYDSVFEIKENVSYFYDLYYSGGGFIRPINAYSTAFFITCSSPYTSYITLDNTNPQAIAPFQYEDNCPYYISFDIFFTGSWSGTLTFKYGSISVPVTLSSSTKYSNGFCDSQQFSVKTVYVQTSGNINADFDFSITNVYTSGTASLRNIIISRPKCYSPACKFCSGPAYNQCNDCYDGIPTNGICPTCSASSPYHNQYSGCKLSCSYNMLKYENGFCWYFPQYYFVQSYFDYYHPNSYENKRWSVIQDVFHINATIGLFYSQGYSLIGVFKYGNAIFRQIDEMTQYNTQGSILIYLTIVVFNPMPLNTGISFRLNNTYYGSLYQNSAGLQVHNAKLFQSPNPSSQNYYTLYMLLNIPQYQFGFSIVGNDTTGSLGWALQNFGVSTGVCPLYCQLCEVPTICKTCKSGYYSYRDGTCLQYCSNYFQAIVNTTYCQDFDDITPYSKYLISEYLSLEADPAQNNAYSIVSQTGTNFLKGQGIYYSFWQYRRVFGGPFVWAKAKFQRQFSIPEPHHKITIAFQIIFGPSNTGSFIYTLYLNSPVTISAGSGQSASDGSTTEKIVETINHSISPFYIQWECLGSEPISGYCAFNNLYVTVHYCMPYCSSCVDQYSCSSWNSSYASAQPKFSQSDCSPSQYFHKQSYTCKPCPAECATCVSEQGCLSCSATYTWSILGCTCQRNQFTQSNLCVDCPIECSQCLSSTYCVECLNSNYRKLVSGQCVCFDGYYAVAGVAQCSVCFRRCKTCSGQNENQCLTCKTAPGFVLLSGQCVCPSGNYYDESSQTCVACYYKCQTCISGFIKTRCLTCSSASHRVLQGLECVCEPGFYEQGTSCVSCAPNEIYDGTSCICPKGFYISTPNCIACPVTEDNTITQCYRDCNTTTLNVWVAVACTTCDPNLTVIDGYCVTPPPVCGDSLITGYEECEDLTNVLNDGCHNCQFQCAQHCTSCDASTVYPCATVCGDGMVTGDEECEDGNTFDEDGCFQCKYKCHHACTKCVLGQCQECATSGFALDQTATPWTCKEKCGDQLVEGLEQCDNPSDTKCVNCRYCRYDCSNCNFSTALCEGCEIQGTVPYLNYCKNNCGDGYVVTDPYQYNTEECDDGNTVNYDGCSNLCKFQCQPITVCAYCVNNKCQACARGYYLIEEKNRCEPMCKDGILVNEEKCEDNLSPPYKCRNCLPICQTSCITCSTNGIGCVQCMKGYKMIDNMCYPICGDLLVMIEEDCDDGNSIPGDGCHFCKYDCLDSCEVCLKGECLDCKEGYYYLNSQCYPIISDGLLAIQTMPVLELCDDGNSKSEDGCFDNQFSCDQNCEICKYGICQYCYETYELNEEGRCDTKCGDGIVTLYSSEQCDDGNDQLYDGCYNCAFECSEFCYYCNEVVCFKCEKGFRINNWLCDPVCGDKYILPYIEECDDGNQIMEDGCFECKLLCCEGCSECKMGVCYGCLQGYEFINQICQTICGDGIVVGKEVCDDMNYEEFDGCFNCQYSCPLNCEICTNGKCVRCSEEFKLIDAFCVYEPTVVVINEITCGNGSLDKDEECDDGNFEPLDGCYNCYVEDNWICDDKGNCYYSKSPQMILTYLNQTLDKQYAMIGFSQEVFIKGNQSLLSILSISIEGLSTDIYKITKGVDLHNQITMEISIFTSLSDKPKLVVQLMGELYNKNDQPIENNEIFIYLNIPQYVDEGVKDQAQNLQSANKNIMIASLAVASLSVCLGDFDIFFETLSTLQFQALVKYINLNFPENLLIYFQSSEIITLQPFFSFLNLDIYVEEITFKKNTIQAQGKFEYYQEDADLFTNVLVQFLQCSFIVLLLFSETILKKIVVFITKTHPYYKLLSFIQKKIDVKYAKRFHQLVCSLPRFIYKFKQKINIYSFRQLLIINAWDILLKSFLYLSSGSQFVSLRADLQTALSFFIIGMYVATIFQSFFPSASSLNKDFDRFQSIELIRVMLFSLVITFVQSTQIIQLVIITMTNLVQLSFLIQKKNIFELPDYISRVSVECSVTIVMITSFVYFQDFSEYFTYESRVKLGQFQIFLMIGGIGMVFSKMIFEKIKSIQEFITQKNKHPQRPKNEVLMNIVL